MPRASEAPSIIDLVEKVAEFGNAHLLKYQTRRALRLTCRRLRTAIDPTITSLTIRNHNYADSFWSCHLLSACGHLAIRLTADNAADADAVVASLAAADLPSVKVLCLAISPEETDDEVLLPLDLGLLQHSTWIGRLTDLSLDFSGCVTDFTAFDGISMCPSGPYGLQW